MIFVDRANVDEAWEKVVAALTQARLGDYAKVSTARPSPNAAAPRTHVICVYTYDADDEDDVRRVRNSLRDLGFVKPIAYKTDQATFDGRYQVRGHQRISKYYE